MHEVTRLEEETKKRPVKRDASEFKEPKIGTAERDLEEFRNPKSKTVAFFNKKDRRRK
jgi:hypothetical protein